MNAAPSAPTLLILIGGHLATAPRPQKEAAAAKAAGFRVEVRGVWWDRRLADEDRQLARDLGVGFAPVVDLTRGGLATRWFRLRQRIAKECCERWNIVLPRAYGLAAPELLGEALRLKADLTMVHSEAGLWVGRQLLRRGRRVGVDFEDWFSEDLPPKDRKGRPVAAIKSLESELARKARPALATTQVMARAIAVQADTTTPPTAIPNSFPWTSAPLPGPPRDARTAGSVSFYWFSQTIGPGRGLETLAQALPQLNGDWEVHLRGELRAYGPWFERTFPASVRSRVHVQATVPNAELAAHSASHDVGLALEIPHCPNRDLTATNKIFEYLRCGLAVIATATQGQLEVMERCPAAGWVVPPDDSAALAAAMQRVLDGRALLDEAKTAARQAGESTWAWERFEPELQRLLRSGAA